MKYVEARPYADQKAAGRRLWEYAKAAKRLQAKEPDRVYVEQVNSPFLFKDGATPAEYTAGMNWLIASPTPPELIQKRTRRDGGHLAGRVFKARSQACGTAA